MSQDSQYALISAYLLGDVTPEERVAVEALIERDPAVCAHVQKMADLLALLAKGKRPVSRRMLTTLQEIVSKKISAQVEALASSALLSASISGDVTEAECTLVRQLVQKFPRKARELDGLKVLSAVLAKGQRTVSDQAASTLSARVRAKLPKAFEQVRPALLPPKAVAQSATAASAMPAAVPDSTSGNAAAATQPSLRPTLRIYVAPEPSPWSRRALWAAAAAAVLAFGIGVAVRFSKHPGLSNDLAVQPSTPSSLHTGPALPTGPERAGPPREITSVPEIPEVAPDPFAVAPPRAPAPMPETPQPEIVHNQPAPRRDFGPVLKQDSVAPRPRSPHVAEHSPMPAPPPAPRESEMPAPEPRVAENPARTEGAVIAQNPPLPPTAGTGTVISRPGLNTTPETPEVAIAPPGDPLKRPTSEEGMDGPGENGDSTTPPAAPTAPAIDNANDAVAAVDDKAVVGAVLNTVQANGPDGANTGLKLRQILSSETEIFTGDGMLALLLPDNGRLYVNRGSNLKFALRGRHGVDVTLRAGEMTYKGNGTLKVNNAGVNVNNGREVNIKIQENRLTVSVMEGNARLSGNGGAMTVGSSAQASVSLNGDDAPVKGEALEAAPDKWRGDLIFPGEGSSGNKATAKENGRQIRSKRSRR